MLKRKKLVIRILVATFLAIVIFTIWINLSVSVLGNKYSHNSIDMIPHNHCALVLGTSKYLSNGHDNLYYLNRIKAAVDIFNNKKVNYIIVSGYNRSKNYNEQEKMFDDLEPVNI